MKKDKALLAMCIGEMYWEFGRLAPHVLWKKYVKYYNIKNLKLIVLTREDRFDIYGRHADVLVPLKINGDYSIYQPDCFKLGGFPTDSYNSLGSVFMETFEKEFDIVDFVKPDITGNRYLNKYQFPRNEMLYEYAPRIANEKLINDFIGEDRRKIIILSPRYRKNFKRNWQYWPEFYDLVYKDKWLMNNFNFIICGKDPDYLPDVKNRFNDLNQIEQNINTSLIGLLMSLLKRAFYTVGSQSAIPNISLLYRVSALEWGNQKEYHVNEYNILKTPVTFIEEKDKTFKTPPNVIFDNMKKLLIEKLEMCR